MYRAAEARGIRHMVYYTWRWQPHNQYLRQLVVDGWFGRILRGQFSFIGNWGLGKDYQWRHDARRANGVLGDLGSHMIDLSRWLLGDIASVSADLPILVDRTGFGGDAPGSDAAHLTMQFASGAQGVIDATTIATVDGVRMLVRIDGEDGSIEMTYIPQGPNIGLTVRGMRKGDDALTSMQVPASYYAGFDATDTLGPYRTQPVGSRLFIDAIAGGFKPEPGFEVGLANQRIIDAAMQSHRERRWVDL
jgi:predicted dehydrogenase